MFWPLVLLLLVLPKDNRNRQAWRILIPLLAIHFLSLAILYGFFLPDEMVDVFYSYISAVAIALACLWLFVHRLAWNRLLCFFSAFIFITCAGLLMLYPTLDPDTIEQELHLIMFCSGLAAIFCLGIAIAAFCCRWLFNVRRFLSWLFLSYLVLSMLFMFIYSIFAAIQFNIRFGDIMVEAFIFSFVLCLFLFVITLPYLILTFTNPFYRQRLCRLLHLHSNYPNS